MVQPQFDHSQKNAVKKTDYRGGAAETTFVEDEFKFAVTINKPLEVVFSFWRELSNLPLFMKDIKEIIEISETESHWVAAPKDGVTAEWDAKIISEITNEQITWSSIEGSEIETKGSVLFTRAPADLGTTVSLRMNYSRKDGDIVLQTDLFRLKALLETGEIPTIEGQSSGRGEDLPSDNVKH